MTRINVIPPEELCDQHLMAEYRELIRIPNAVYNRKMSIDPQTNDYVLGTGHVKFFSNKLAFLHARHAALYRELVHRGVKVKEMVWDCTTHYVGTTFVWNHYNVTPNAIAINIARVIDRKPRNARWTNRLVPHYMENVNVHQQSN